MNCRSLTTSLYVSRVLVRTVLRTVAIRIALPYALVIERDGYEKKREEKRERGDDVWTI